MNDDTKGARLIAFSSSAERVGLAPFRTLAFHQQLTNKSFGRFSFFLFLPYYSFFN